MNGEIETTRLRRTVRARDNHQCQVCWRKDGQADLRVCQIVPLDDGRLRLSNHITLCHRHYQMMQQRRE